MTDEETETIRLHGIEYRLPYGDVLEQTVDDESLIASIEKEGMIYPIVWRKTDEGREIVDGNTRARLIAQGKVDLGPDETPLEEVEVKGDDEEEIDEHAYDLAIQLNFQRRQISPNFRRKTIEKIMDRKPWRKASAHVKDFAELLGVSKPTISNDIAKIEGGDEEQELREERSRINYLLTGLRYLDKGEVEKPDLSDEFGDDEVEIGEKYLDAVKARLEGRREKLNEALQGNEG